MKIKSKEVHLEMLNLSGLSKILSGFLLALFAISAYAQADIQNQEDKSESAEGSTIQSGEAQVYKLKKDKVSFMGSYSVDSAEIGDLKVAGPVTITNSAIGYVKVAGPFTGTNLRLKDGKVSGPVTLKDSEISGQFKISGPVIIESSKVSQSIGINSNHVEFINSVIEQDLYIESKNDTPKLKLRNSKILGKVHFTEKPGEIELDSNSKVEGKITNGL